MEGANTVRRTTLLLLLLLMAGVLVLASGVALAKTISGTEAGEKIVGEPQIGDSVRWNISPALYGVGDDATSVIVLKPQVPGLDTNLLVTTDRDKRGDSASALHRHVQAHRPDLPGRLLLAMDTGGLDLGRQQAGAT